MQSSYVITGMHCGACVAKVTAALKPFADAVSVSLDPPRATLSEPAASARLDALNAALAGVGSYRLAPAKDAASEVAPHGAPDTNERSWLETYFPLLLIAGYISVASLAGTERNGAFDWSAWMTNFMAGFFLVFSAFKFLNLRGFADAYASYDLLAKRWPTYGFIYPFLELALGLALLFRIAPLATNFATVALMGFSSLGVIAALRQNRKIVCACLGTVLNLPMSTITLVEDLGMVAMAVFMVLSGSHN